METPLDQPYTPPPNDPKRMPLGLVVMINFGIMLAYLVLTAVTMSTTGNEAALGIMAVDAFLIVAQFGINFVLGLIFLFTDLRHVGRAMIIAALLVGVIGFGACFGKIALMEA